MGLAFSFFNSSTGTPVTQSLQRNAC